MSNDIASHVRSNIPPPKRLPWYSKLGMQVSVATGSRHAVGLSCPEFGGQLKLLGDMFLSLIKAGVAPLVFLTIVHGIASAGDVKSAGRVGWRSIVYFEVISTIALGRPAGGQPAEHRQGHDRRRGRRGTAGDRRRRRKASSSSSRTSFRTTSSAPSRRASCSGRRAGGHGRHRHPRDSGRPPREDQRRARPDLRSALLVHQPGDEAGTHRDFRRGRLLGRQQRQRGAGRAGAAGPQLLRGHCVFIVVVLGLIAKFAGFSLWRFLRYIKDEILIVLGTASSESALPRL